MPIGKHIDPQIKTEIISKIRDEGMIVMDASNTYGVHNKTIYGWLKNGIETLTSSSAVKMLSFLPYTLVRFLTSIIVSSIADLVFEFKS